MKIADAAVELMTREGVSTVMWGDGILTSIAYHAGCNARHPLDAMARTLAALEKDDRFEKVRIHGHDSRARPRLVRGFVLKILKSG